MALRLDSKSELFRDTLRLTRADRVCNLAVFDPILSPEHELKGSTVARDTSGMPAGDALVSVSLRSHRSAWAGDADANAYAVVDFGLVVCKDGQPGGGVKL